MCAPSLSMQLIHCVPNKRSEDCPKSLPPASGVLPYLKMMRHKDDSSTDSGISKGIHKITIFGIIISRYDITLGHIVLNHSMLQFFSCNICYLFTRGK